MSDAAAFGAIAFAPQIMENVGNGMAALAEACQANPTQCRDDLFWFDLAMNGMLGLLVIAGIVAVYAIVRQGGLSSPGDPVDHSRLLNDRTEGEEGT